ncbi:DUF2127 domain-containing protein [Streptacidiphilus anmyonensis]|uniref:DUF2127 domain-containing protein n=1 Tax=Streptacidiphilus anmyonensis TaxID=405782 RepID=UPI0005A8A774|nr:DUF2127 domain-containing protein [Streptacidiphilus anmyonensis]
MARNRLNLELLTCASSGHVLAAPADVDEHAGPQLVRRTEDGLCWRRCLRCDVWIPSRAPQERERRQAGEQGQAHAQGPGHAQGQEQEQAQGPGHVQERGDAPAGRGPSLVIPERGRALRDRYVLRLIALDRLLHFLLLGTAAAVVFAFTADRARLSGPFYRVVDALQNGVGGVGARPGTGVAGELEKAFQASSSKLWLLGAALAAYALLEGVEAVGLWRARRWAEYLTFVATTILLVPEVWELTSRVTVFKVVALVVNIAVVAYLLHAKRLFGLRGGPLAERLERERDMSWEALERAFPHP